MRLKRIQICSPDTDCVGTFLHAQSDLQKSQYRVFRMDPPPHYGLFALYSKKTSDDPYLKLLNFSQLWIFFSLQNFCLHSLTALLGHPVQKYYFIFALIKKIFLQTLVFWDPPTNKKKKNENSIYVYDCWVSKSGERMRAWISFLKEFLGNIQKWRNGSICAYKVFYLPIFRRIEAGSYGTEKSVVLRGLTLVNRHNRPLPPCVRP